MSPNDNQATMPPGAPGIAPHWTSSAKSGVGTAISMNSRVWFTVSHGIVDEVYYPRFDLANTRDFGLLVSDRKAFFSEEKRDTVSAIEMLAPGVPAFRLTNTDRDGRYTIIKTVLTDPEHDVLLQHIRFQPLQGSLDDYALFALLAPHVANRGAGNDAWVGAYKGIKMLFAQRDGIALALACSRPFVKASCGYVGTSDGWQDVSQHYEMQWTYPSAPNGNVALTAELDLQDGAGEIVLALGFGLSPAEAALHARASLLKDFDGLVQSYINDWQKVQDAYLPIDDGGTLYRVSTSVLRSHTSKTVTGGMIASLSIPWGTSKGDDDLGGYHLVWPRDLAESAGGLLAAGDSASPLQSLTFFMATQEADGHWPQNMWFTGESYWSGTQMDETAFPILLADCLQRAGVLGSLDVWPMVRQAAAFIASNGPVTMQDRWEEDGGYSPFTLAVEIAALLAAADFADAVEEADIATYLRETADAWNSLIERWTYTAGGDLARRVGVDGYYVRITPPNIADTALPSEGFVPIKNRPPGDSSFAVAAVVSPDALALVRFGLRAPDDPHILNTVKVIDALLRTETATGPVWHRYDDDGYGEHADGGPFDGVGIGRGWPLLAGERAHYELAAGNIDEARRLLHVMEAQSSPGGLIPEQVWDAPDIPELELMNGHPSGSAMPLVWAHAEYVKLLRSLRDGDLFDRPPQTYERYVKHSTPSTLMPWRFNQKCTFVLAGKTLRIETLAPVVVHWSADGWQTVTDTEASDRGLGIYVADLPTASLPAGTTVSFTFYWPNAGHWEGNDFAVSMHAEL